MDIENSIQDVLGYMTCKWIAEGKLGMDMIDHISQIKCTLSVVNEKKSELIVHAHLFWLRLEIVTRMGVKMSEMTMTMTNADYVAVKHDLTRSWKDYVACVDICERFMDKLHATFYSRVMARLFQTPRLEVDAIPALNRVHSYGKDIEYVNVVMDHVLLNAGEMNHQMLMNEYNEVKTAVRDFWRMVEEFKEDVRSKAIDVIWNEMKLKNTKIQAICLREIDLITTEPDIVWNLLEMKRLIMQDYRVNQ
jgi:hypothetical protein